MFPPVLLSPRTPASESATSVDRSYASSRYPSRKVGFIDKVYDGAFTYLCDTAPDGVGPAMPVSCVGFYPEEMWPGMAETNFTIYADLFEHYFDRKAALAV